MSNPFTVGCKVISNLSTALIIKGNVYKVERVEGDTIHVRVKHGYLLPYAARYFELFMENTLVKDNVDYMKAVRDVIGR